VLELLDVPLRLHEAGGGLMVVCMDEFRDLLVADDALDGFVRSVIQHHGDAAAYVFAGSQPSLMRALFSDHERPFYGQARPLELPRLPVEEARRDIEALLGTDGLDARSAVDELLSFTQSHPQRTVLLAHLAGEHRVARSTLREALERLLSDARHVQRDDEETPFLLDPLLAEWLRRR
jgi:hypothetical protein